MHAEVSKKKKIPSQPVPLYQGDHGERKRVERNSTSLAPSPPPHATPTTTIPPVTVSMLVSAMLVCPHHFSPLEIQLLFIHYTCGWLHCVSLWTVSDEYTHMGCAA